MTVRAVKFTPAVLLSAPRRGPATPSHDGLRALYSESRYSFQTHAKTAEIRVYDLESGQSSLVTDDGRATDPTWLGRERKVIWLQQEDGGRTRLMIRHLDEQPEKTYVAGTVSGPVSNLKLKPLADGSLALAVTGQVAADGRLHNPESVAPRHSTGRVYRSLFVRHWDAYVTPRRTVIWCGVLRKESRQGDFQLASTALFNVLAASDLECPVPPFGGTNDFDLSEHGLLLVAKDPTVNAATSTRSDPYYVPVSFAESRCLAAPQRFETGDLQGTTASPVFSPDGRRAACVRMRDMAYESDKFRVVVLRDVTRPTSAVEVFPSDDGRGRWDRSPQTVQWSPDGRWLILKAEEHGRARLYLMPSDPSEVGDLPAAIASARPGSVSAAYPLAHGSSRLLVSSSSFIHDSVWAVVDPLERSSVPAPLSSRNRDGGLFGLRAAQVSKLWYRGAEEHDVHAWVVRPSDYDATRTYPLALLIHGGPQGAWTDSWSTRWNAAVFAEQGYIVVAPNPTGSTGYGQAFVDAIQHEWGGRPYRDLERLMAHLAQHRPDIDLARAVALGASYGGYMINWMQGQPLGRRFQALVTHDGVFSTLNQYATDELWFPVHDFGGSLWANRAGYERWDPARFADRWQTPHLVVHSALDYRLPIAEGLAAFNVLQQRAVPSRFLTFPDENHWVLKPENSLVWHREVLNWINAAVGLPLLDEEEGGEEAGG
ncbi:MAG: hypothetical protein M1826_004432 [Phylliscum demangeonii]|nr:MAG: hypothetical protein M1826_004432 [Phylliscum demangeonii]